MIVSSLHNMDCYFLQVYGPSLCLKILKLLLGSMSVNVSVTSSKDEYINARARQTSISSSKIGILSKLLPVSIVALSMHIIIFMKSPLL
jgi:hypothetical protein